MQFITTTRILAMSLLSYAGGVWLGKYLLVPHVVPVLITFGYLICCRWFDRFAHRTLLYSWLLLMLFGLGTLAVQTRMINPIPDSAYNKAVTFLGTVAYDPAREKEWYSTKASGFIYVGDSEDAIATNAKVILRVRCHEDATPFTYKYGDVIKATGELRRPSGQRNPGGFDYRQYLITQGIFGTIHRVETIEHIGSRNGKISLIWAESMQRKIQLILGQLKHGDVLRAMCLGERSLLKPETLETFQKGGAAHILAVSGLHIGLIALCCAFSLKFLIKSKTAVNIITMVVIFCYALIIGFSPSVIRATSMCIIFLGARTLGKKLDILDVILSVALAVLLINPLYLWSVGFQLSFSAVLTIVLFMPAWEHLMDPVIEKIDHEKYRKWLKWTIDGFGVTISANIGTMLLSAYYFNKIPLVGIICAPWIMGQTTIIVAVTFLTTVLGLIYLPLSSLFLLEIDFLVRAFLDFMRLITVPNLVVNVGTPSFLAILFWLTAIVYLRQWAGYWVQYGKRMFYPITAIFMAWLISSGYGFVTTRRTLEVTFIDVGQGDSIFVKFPTKFPWLEKRKTLLIDAGNFYQNSCTEKRSNAGENTVAPFLAHRGQFDIDVVLLTHPDNDHIGGLPHIINEFDVGYVLGATPKYREFLPYRIMEATVKARGVPVSYDTADLNGLTDAATIKLISPRKGDSKNDRSLCVKITYGRIKFLLTGDIERVAELALSNSGEDLSAHFLQAPHHGSKTSSSDTLLNAVNPTYAIVSCGVRNRYGHPHPTVLERYRARGIKVLRTDKQGAVTIRTDGKRCWINKHIEEYPNVQ